MARPGLTQHPKFRRLARLLGSAPLALGCLELMWEVCYQNGEPYLGDTVDVEAAAQWPGEPKTLCQALLDAGGPGRAGFIEEAPDRPGCYQCHDLYDHAPAYVAKRMVREAARVERGQTLSDLRAEAGRKGGKQKVSKREANGQPFASEKAENEANGQQIARTPAPAPAPAPIKDSCAEPATADSTPVVLALPCVGKDSSPWLVTEGRLAEWRAAFPGVDVLAEARKMLLWLQDPANAARRKTHKGMGRFAMGWLERAQNSGGPRASPGRVTPLQPRPGPAAPAFRKLLSAGEA